MGGLRAVEASWGQSPGLAVMAAGGRSPSKNIRLFKVEVNSVKLLAMVELLEWIGVWKRSKWNNNLLLLKSIPGPTPTFWERKEKSSEERLKNRICTVLLLLVEPRIGGPDTVKSSLLLNQTCTQSRQTGPSAVDQWRRAHSCQSKAVVLVHHDFGWNMITSSIYPADTGRSSHSLETNKQALLKHDTIPYSSAFPYSISYTIKNHDAYKVMRGLQARERNWCNGLLVPELELTNKTLKTTVINIFEAL